MSAILVVDDERSIRITIGEFLKRQGYSVAMAENADEAITYVSGNPCDVVLTDIIMPRVSGITLMKRLRELSPDLRIIVMTGEPTVETATEAVRAGAHDYLPKPIQKEELLKAVHNAVCFKQLVDEKRELERQSVQYQRDLELLVDERTSKLRQAMLNITSAVAAMVELRDPYTAGHQRRVGDLAANIGREMGLSAEIIEGLKIAGYIHDVGKIVVPAEILSKPSSLLPPEYEIIKLHVEKGYSVIKDFEMPWPVAEIVYQHHERLDGSGYPRGFLGGQIMDQAKILMVADVVEAMMTHRPYRPSLGIDAAMEEITEFAGEKYDRDVVAACRKMIEPEGR